MSGKTNDWSKEGIYLVDLDRVIIVQNLYLKNSNHWNGSELSYISQRYQISFIIKKLLLQSPGTRKKN